MKNRLSRLILLITLLSVTPSHARAEITATLGAIGGWTLGTTTLVGGNATLASSGNLTLGTLNDVMRASADDVTYRLWVGNATAASAPFRVGKGGAVNASNLTVTGGSITGTTATFASVVTLDSNGIAITPSTSGFVDARAYKFGNGVGLYAVNDNAFVRGTAVSLQATGSRSLSLGSGGLLDESGNIDMNIGGAVRFPGVNTSGATRFLCISAAGLLSAATSC